jgi:S-adenosylmethionine:tRNA ribosyltransferase-isomerase
VRTAEFHFDLPPELIAQFPAAQRDESRLLVLNRASGSWNTGSFATSCEYLRAGDVLVLNNSRVIPARLHGTNAKTGGAFEILLLEETATNDWWAMMKPGKRARLGTEIKLTEKISATVTATNDEGHRRLTILRHAETFSPNSTRSANCRCRRTSRATEKICPPSDKERYQTVFAQPAGSVAAPTAGLHFTETLLAEIRRARCGNSFRHAARRPRNVRARESGNARRTRHARGMRSKSAKSFPRP